MVSCVLLRNLLDIGTSSTRGVGGDGFTGFVDTVSVILPSSGEAVLHSAREGRVCDFSEMHVSSHI